LDSGSKTIIGDLNYRLQKKLMGIDLTVEAQKIKDYTRTIESFGLTPCKRQVRGRLAEL
jgi:hypothetical protein